MLTIENLNVKIDGKEIIRNFSLSMDNGEIHVLMGPNGSGKTTLAYAIAGHPKYSIEGKIVLNGEEISKTSADIRAKKGIFLAFQEPVAIEGLGLVNLIRKAANAIGKNPEDVMKFSENMEKNAKMMKLNPSVLSMSLNKGLSGGEKKKSEILQMLALSPKMIILDEINSGLDVDSLKVVARAITSAKDKTRTFLIITHYTNILKYLKPDYVHVMINGKIVKSGGAEFAKVIEKKGYGWIKTSSE